MIRHPAQSLCLGTFPMGLATIVNIVVSGCVPAWGPRADTLAWVLEWTDAVIVVTVCFWMPFVFCVDVPPSSGRNIDMTGLIHSQNGDQWNNIGCFDRVLNRWLSHIKDHSLKGNFEETKYLNILNMLHTYILKRGDFKKWFVWYFRESLVQYSLPMVERLD